MTKEKRKPLLKFVLLYIGSILLIVAIFSAFTFAGRKEQSDDSEELLAVNELLNNYALQLNRLNEQYLATSEFPITDNKRALINLAQKELKDQINTKIDSIKKASSRHDQHIQLQFNAAIFKFQAAMQNWETENTLILATKGTDTTAIKELGNQLRLKEERIALLEDQLKASQLKVKSVSAILQKDKEDIHFLEWAVRSQVSTIKSLENKLKNR